jgi:23S rRNA G2069 N7-methylase RlmK/C1962 C5-methylase RlmI
LERDYPGLVTRACSLLREGGLLWLACNAREASLPGLARRGLQAARRHGQILETGGLPPDHPTLPSQPEDRYLEVALFRVE